MSKNTVIEIPQHRPIPVLGNLLQIDAKAPIQSLTKMAQDFDGIFRLSLPNSKVVIVTSQELVNEICNESLFDKKVSKPLEEIRPVAGDGLFTADTHSPNWGKAHRILMTAFGPSSLRNMFPGMLDIAEQMLLKWERLGDGTSVDIADNMTRLTLDTIALTAFGFRFNSFYEKQIHPFVDAMVRSLEESGLRSRRPSLATRLMLMTQRQFTEDARYLHEVSDQLVAERKRDPIKDSKKDLLSVMLNSIDPVTGEGLDDTNIRYQMVTFLIAGHETTSGLLSFAIYALLKNPEALKKIREEVAQVLGNRTPQFEDIAKLVYVDQVLKETLRMWPTAPGFAVATDRDDIVLNNKYRIEKNETLLVLTPALHHDAKVWKDSETFDPDRMSPEKFRQLPRNAWKPFGNGQRGCIGRGFAMQEAILVLAMVVQRFNLEFSDPQYSLQIKETLTLKPENLFIRFKKRSPLATTTANSVVEKSAPLAAMSFKAASKNRPFRILYGSNTGSSEAFAQRIAADARANSYVTSLGTLDSAVGNLSAQEPLVIVTASYEGRPPDNAKKFITWLDSLSPGSLQGLQYTVFGCGNKDWTRTYQAIPKLIDQKLEEAGGTRLHARGEADARGDFFGDFDRWYESFWSEMSHASGQDLKTTSNNEELTLEFLESPQKIILESPPRYGSHSRKQRARGYDGAEVIKNTESL